MTIFDKYKAEALIPFSFKIELNELINKKVVVELPSYGQFTKYNK